MLQVMGRCLFEGLTLFSLCKRILGPLTGITEHFLDSSTKQFVLSDMS